MEYNGITYESSPGPHQFSYSFSGGSKMLITKQTLSKTLTPFQRGDIISWGCKALTIPSQNCAICPRSRAGLTLYGSM